MEPAPAPVSTDPRGILQTAELYIARSRRYLRAHAAMAALQLPTFSPAPPKRQAGFARQTEIRACIREALSPLAGVLYGEAYIYIWLAGGYSALLILLTVANLVTAQRLLSQMQAVASKN